MSAKWIPPATIEPLFAASASNTKFGSINAPTAGARYERELERGSAPFQFYSLATPNGMKPAILLEELGIDYDAHKISIMAGDQFSSGYVAVNPNSKIPSAVDYDTEDGKPVNLFESASIMVYLSDKHGGKFMPKTAALRAEVMNWLFWQMAGQGPMSGNFGHFFAYSPADAIGARDYGVARYGMELQRLCAVLNNHLSTRTYMVNEEYSLADMACFPWARQARNGYPFKFQVPASRAAEYAHGTVTPVAAAEATAGAANEGNTEEMVEVTLTAGQFLSFDQNYPHVVAWIERLMERPAVQRGITVCGFSSEVTKPWLQNKD